MSRGKQEKIELETLLDHAEEIRVSFNCEFYHRFKFSPVQFKLEEVLEFFKRLVVRCYEDFDAKDFVSFCFETDYCKNIIKQRKGFNLRLFKCFIDDYLMQKLNPLTQEEIREIEHKRMIEEEERNINGELS